MHQLTRLLITAVLAIPAVSQAQAVYKCVEPGKPVSFQTAPCGAGATVAAVTAFTPDRELSWQEKQQRDAQWATRRNPAPASAAAVVPAAPVRAVDHCGIARRERDAWERNAGLSRTYEAVRRWNDHVARACH